MHSKEMNHNDLHSTMHYRRLLVMAVLSFISMYILMYAMVDSVENVYSNFNQVYMAGLMTAPMVVIELIVMSTMYKNKSINSLIFIASVSMAILFFAFIRQQIAITDKQFLRSMIPHHAGAILMCRELATQNSNIAGLCKNIIASQQAEIAQMKMLLSEIEH